MMRLQDTSTNLQTSLATGLEKYENALYIQGKRKKSHQLVSQTRSLKFQYIVGSKEDYAY